MPSFFSIKDFSCGYSNRYVLENINFDISKGVLSGIIGPNGSGKTTLFRGITGQLSTKKGEVYLNGNDLQRMTYKEKARHIAVVSQHTNATDITVEDYVLMGRLPHRKKMRFFETAEDYEIAYKFMELTNVIHLKDKLMSKISGGEQQLANIARALTQQPDLLLLDEPTSHLDITHQVQILNLIQKLNHEMGLSVLMIIHDLNLAGEYCDYLIMLNDGKIHKKGLPEKVLNYKDIEEVYNTVVVVKPNPISDKPSVFLVSEKILNKMED